jgi:predicted RNase H-like HicB family nuclease
MFLSWCPLVDVYSQGDSEQEAKDNLVDALSLFFISCIERNTLDDVLKECGFRPFTVGNVAEQIGEEFIDVNIPFEVAKTPCHA